jgi:hypothetical protein
MAEFLYYGKDENPFPRYENQIIKKQIYKSFFFSLWKANELDRNIVMNRDLHEENWTKHWSAFRCKETNGGERIETISDHSHCKKTAKWNTYYENNNTNKAT